MSVREDGLAAVLGPLLTDRQVTAAALVDLDSGMVLDACSALAGAQPSLVTAAELETLGVGHAELVRVALGVLRGRSTSSAEPDYELVLSSRGGPHHLLRGIPDSYGDRLVLSVVVAGSDRVLERVRRRLRAVSQAALTAGPTVTRRPREHGWQLGVPERRPAGATTPGWAAGTAALAAPALTSVTEPALVRLVEPIAVPPDLVRPTVAVGPRRLATRPPVADGRPAPPSALPPAPWRPT